MVSYRALALDAGAAELGLIAASFGILSLLVVVPAGRWVDRLGETRFMAAGMGLVAGVGLVLMVSDSLFVLALAMMALGVGQIVAAVAIQTLVANGGSPAGRDGRFGTQTVVASFGQLIGPAAAGLIVAAAIGSAATPGGAVPIGATDGVFLLGAVTALGATALALSLGRWPPRRHARRDRPPDPPGPSESTRAAVGRVMRVPSIPQAMLSSLAVLSCVDILVVYLPLLGTAYGIPVETVGLLLAVRGGASITSRALMLPLRRLLGRRPLLVGSMILAAVMLALLPLAGNQPATLFAAVALIGFGLEIGQPLTLSWIATRAPVEIRGTAIAVRLSANRFGQFAVPAAAGLVAGVAGLALTFWLLAAVLALSALLVARTPFDARMVDEAPEPPEPPDWRTSPGPAA